MIALSPSASRRGFGDRAIGFITRLCASLAGAPSCCACASRKAQTSWMLDALGGVRGFCADCAGQGEVDARRY